MIQLNLSGTTRKPKKGEERMSGYVYRRRPLHTCGVSLMDITRNAHNRAKALNGPIGSITTKLSSLASPASPFLHVLRCHFLSFLSFLDHRILSLQNVVEAFFPPSTYLFDKIDGLLQIVESLPAKFNDAADQFPGVIRRVPLLDWALAYAASWLDFWLFALADLRKEATTTREKEIVVVIKCDDGTADKSGSRSPSCNEMVNPRLSKGSYKEVLQKGTKESALVSYKQVLEKGTKESAPVKLHESENDRENATAGCSGDRDASHAGMKEESVDKEEDSAKLTERFSNGVAGNGDGSRSKMGTDNNKEDLILSLFESAWLMKPSSTKQ